MNKYISIGLILVMMILSSCGEQEAVVEKQAEEAEIIEEIIVDETATEEKVSYDFESVSGEAVTITPIGHATAVIQWGETTIYIDPAEEISAYEGLDSPDLIFITHVHGDHLKTEVLEELYTDSVGLVVPASVNTELNQGLQDNSIVMETGITSEVGDFTVTTVPAYNIREEALNFHPESRNDNGYIIEKDGLRIYFAGDSEDTAEMRALENIDVAFLPMNLPYTMTVESAASAVLEFTPKTIFPYHYRGTDGQSDIEGFKNLVNAGNTDIEVVLHDWYAE